MLYRKARPNPIERIQANLEAAMDVICVIEDVISYHCELAFPAKSPVFVLEIHLQATEGVIIHLDPVTLMDMSRKDLVIYILAAFGWQKVEEYPL
jgi:hypothetical protein